VGTIDLRLASDLRDQVGLQRAIETGTYLGGTARALASVFGSVITIELSRSLHERAVTGLRDLPQVEAMHGHSSEVLHGVVRCDVPTLYFLDGHWSGGSTEGAADECPVLDELAAIGAGHRDDCLVIDDARLFTSAPPPPHNPTHWPTIVEVFDAIRSQRPGHVVTLLADQIIAVPQRAKPAVDAYGARLQAQTMGLGGRVIRVLVDTPRRISRAGYR
jgi:hypothetical protein